MITDALGQRGEYELYTLMRPVGSAPIPNIFDWAGKLMDQGQALYASGEYEAAAELFADLAARLHLENDQPYHNTVAANRLAAYKNAALAWSMADKPDKARQLVGDAAATDTMLAAALNDFSAKMLR